MDTFTNVTHIIRGATNPRIMITNLKIGIAILITLLQGCAGSSNDASVVVSDQLTPIQQQAVAMPDSYAADVAMAVLNDGGNAIDAAIAAQFSLAVTLPEAGNIGGGGFMVVHYNGQQDFLDYRETAPIKAARDMYLDENGDVRPLDSIFGILASGTPGTVSGMWEAHKKYGSLPWSRLLSPAIQLAQDGFIVHSQLAEQIQDYQAYLDQNKVDVNFANYFASASANSLFKQPELANTLRHIRDNGWAGFYTDEVADTIVRFMQQHGGLISHQDLQAYQAVWRAPIISDWRDYQVVSAAPPSSGGIAISQWLNMYDLVTQSLPKYANNSPEYTHLLAEIGKRVFADRAEYLAKDYLNKRASHVNLKSISETISIRPGLQESEQTTHFSIVDRDGNAVSNTTTINLGFGSGMVVEGAGFLLNDEMDDFSVKPGVPNYFGAVGGIANQIQPQKRMLSSMTPTLLLQNNQIKMVTGSPGGTTIISSVYLSILNAIEFGLSAQQSVDNPRFHHQLLPENQIRHHSGFPTQSIKALSLLGYDLTQDDFGDLHVIINNDGQLEAASQSSGRGKAMVE